MRIGDVAERLGMPASTIRYYEKVGLIAPQRRVSGRRVFDEAALFELEFVHLAQAAGFTLAEIKSLLEAYARDPSVSGMWKSVAQTKRAEVRMQIEKLGKMERILTLLLSCHCASLDQCVQWGIANRVGR